MSGCRDVRTELGAYALGLLDDDDARRVEQHLLGCADCRAEVEELRGTSSLLRGMSVPGSHHDPAAPPADRALAAIGAERRRQRRLLGGAAGAAGILGVVALTLALTLGGRPIDPQPPRGPELAMRSDAGGAAGSVRLTARPWGTQVDLRADHLPPVAGPGGRYDVWLAAADGRRIPAGTCRPRDGAATLRMRLGAAIRLEDVAAVGMSRAGDPSGRAILRVAIS